MSQRSAALAVHPWVFVALPFAGSVVFGEISAKQFETGLLILSAALSFALVKVTPALAEFIRNVGFAVADVNDRFKDVDDLMKKVDVLESEKVRMSAEMESEKVRMSAEMASEKARMSAEMASRDRDEAARAERRKAEREFANTTIHSLTLRVRELDRKDRVMEPRVERNEVAIGRLAVRAHMDLPALPPPAPEEPDGT